MFSAELKPFNKCILTNILPCTKYSEYTSGILVYVEDTKNNLDVLCTVLLTGIDGKKASKPSLIKLRTPPIVCKDLIGDGFYCDSSGFLITDMHLISYLDMSNIEFLNNMYARIWAINKIASNYFKPNILININNEVRLFYTQYSEATKINTNALGYLVNSANKRNKLIYNVMLIESFVKTTITRPTSFINFLKKNLQLAAEYKKKEAIKKLTVLINDIKPHEQILNTLQENKDVLYRYKNSGYWI